GDGIRDFHVTGVQTCALPIWAAATPPAPGVRGACAPWSRGTIVENESQGQTGLARHCSPATGGPRRGGCRGPGARRAAGRSVHQELGEMEQWKESVGRLPTEWLENYVAALEAGRVQKHPQARCVTGGGECCMVGALAGAASAEAFAGSPLWRLFLGSELETLSRRFEAARLTGQEFYEEALMVLAARAAGAAEAVEAPAAA